MKRKLIIFDVCGTLVEVNSSVFFLQFMISKSDSIILKLLYWLHNKLLLLYSVLKKISGREIERYIFSMFINKVRKENKYISQFKELYLKQLKKDKRLQKVLESKNEKDIILISASIEEPIQILATHLDLKYYSSLIEKGRSGFIQDLLNNKQSLFINKLLDIEKYDEIEIYTDEISDFDFISYLINTKKIIKSYIVNDNLPTIEKRRKLFNSIDYTNYEFIS